MDVLDLDSDTFVKFNINWDFKLQRVGDKVSIWLQPLEEVNNIVELVVRFGNNSNGKTLIRRDFEKDFRNGAATKIGSDNYISYTEFMNPDNGIVIDNVAHIIIEISMRSQ